MRPLVIIESPYGKRTDGSTASPEEIERNVTYGLRALRDSLERGEAPFGSHLLYTLVYDDADAEQRAAGMAAGFAWGEAAAAAAIYVDYGITPGMAEGLARHEHGGLMIDYREIGLNP